MGQGFTLDLHLSAPQESPQASLYALTLVEEEQGSWTGLPESIPF